MEKGNNISVIRVYEQSFVELLYDIGFFGESEELIVKKRDPNVINLPEEVYGFRFFDRTIAEILRNENGKRKNEKLFGEKRNYSKTYLIGRVYTLKEVKEQMPDKKALIYNMEVNNADEVVKTRTGRFILFDKLEDILWKEE